MKKYFDLALCGLLAPNLQARLITAHDLLVHHEIPAYTNFFPIYWQIWYEKFFLSPKKYAHIIRKVVKALEFSYVLQFFKEDSSTIRVFGICILSLYAWNSKKWMNRIKTDDPNMHYANLKTRFSQSRLLQSTNVVIVHVSLLELTNWELSKNTHKIHENILL